MQKTIEKMNTTQRAGVFACITALLVAIFLHNPVSGYYETSYSFPEMLKSPVGPPKDAGSEQRALYDKCSAATLQRTNAIFDEKTAPSARQELNREGCFTTYYLPLSEWETKDPFVPWLGNAMHLIWLSMLIIGLAVSWHFLFKHRPE